MKITKENIEKMIVLRNIGGWTCQKIAESLGMNRSRISYYTRKMENPRIKITEKDLIWNGRNYIKKKTI